VLESPLIDNGGASRVSPLPMLSQAHGGAEVRYFEPAPPAVRHERILRIQGYTDMTRVRPAIVRAAVEMASVASSLALPKAAYRYVPLQSISGDALTVQGDVCFHCRAFESRLTDCFEVVPVVLSVGVGVGQRVVDLCEAGDLLEAVLLETAGWLCIEDATRQFTSHLRDEVTGRGGRITSRMGPGYSYHLGSEEVTWPLEQQPELFSLFGAAELPVSLMSSCAMSPKLSRSGLYGIRPLRLAQSPSGAAPLLN
jgi:hypothetical protein